MILNNGIDRTTRILLMCGSIGCVLFIVLFLIQGIIREGYTPLKFPVSSLAIGDAGWVQTLNFLISGLLVFLFAIGFRRATPLLKKSVWTSRLIAAVGIGLIGAGLFKTDPVYGYPTTEPLALAQFTPTGHLHDVFSIFVFTCAPIVIFKMRRRFTEADRKGWAAYSFLSAISMIGFFMLAGAGFRQTPNLVEFAGVFQRVTIIIGFSWLTALSVFIINNSKKI